MGLCGGRSASQLASLLAAFLSQRGRLQLRRIVELCLRVFDFILVAAVIIRSCVSRKNFRLNECFSSHFNVGASFKMPSLVISSVLENILTLSVYSSYKASEFQSLSDRTGRAVNNSPKVFGRFVVDRAEH